MNLDEICVLDALVKGDHINIFTDRCELSNGGKRVRESTIRTLKRLGYIAEVRPGNYDLSDKGKAVWRFETICNEARQ